MKSARQQWKCISQCGACCRLDPLERTEAIESLNPEQAREYLQMVGKNGWCIYYDTGSRRCRIYENRPDFCKVANLKQFFDVDTKDYHQNAIKFCIQQIKSIYGGRSKELRRFRQEIKHTKNSTL